MNMRFILQNYTYTDYCTARVRDVYLFRLSELSKTNYLSLFGNKTIDELDSRKLRLFNIRMLRMSLPGWSTGSCAKTSPNLTSSFTSGQSREQNANRPQFVIKPAWKR